MSDHWHTIAEWAQHASAFRKLKAYGVTADGTRQLLDCEAILIELDEERGLIVALAERKAGEGVAICSLPQGPQPSAAESGDQPPLDPSHGSLIVMRSGGANLLYLSPERHLRGDSQSQTLASD
ncbi:MAG: hypothetical protein VKM34_01815 [Cyanobacteriota bacterium]|nr:hypothetical protein [Cyanobacteriota bacterium]